MNYNDLISRQQLLEHLVEEEKMIHSDAKRFKINKDVLEGMKQNINAVMDYVKEADVSYDVDKVVEKLSDIAIERYGNDGGMGGEKVVNLDDAIEIVKAGLAVEDDVCEWKTAGANNAWGDLTVL